MSVQNAQLTLCTLTSVVLQIWKAAQITYGGYLRHGRGPFPSLNVNRQRTPACDRIAITR